MNNAESLTVRLIIGQCRYCEHVIQGCYLNCKIQECDIHLK